MPNGPTLMPGCSHHWRITEPNGPTVAGRCLLCGEERLFPSADRTYDETWSRLVRRNGAR